MVILFDRKTDCCGCTACMNICPSAAISMTPDQEGFLYPTINSDICTECGLCKKVCAFQKPEIVKFSPKPQAIYAIKNADEAMRVKSQSGGFAFLAACKTVGEQGVVYGAGYDDNMVVIHKAFETRESLSEYQGSKYVQSSLAETFASVKKSLRAGRKVLFTGTPCQVAGLMAFLQGNSITENLYTLDIVCHGVPSPMIFKDYLAFSEKKYCGKISDFNFRDKGFGWRSSIQSFMVGTKKYSDTVFSKLFYSEAFTRSSCYQCPYTKPNRVSDITMADFWGVEKCMPEFDDNKGVSLVLINTEKGQCFFDLLRENMLVCPVETEDYLQPQLRHPSVVSPIRDKVWQEYWRYGFSYIAKTYCGDNFRQKAKDTAIKILKKMGILYSVKKFIDYVRGI